MTLRGVAGACRPPPVAVSVPIEGADPCRCGLAINLPAGCGVALVGLPVLARDVGVSVHGAMGGGKQGVSLQADLGGELARALGAVGVAGSILPLAMAVALTALELLVAFLQAYVFAVLTCMYLNDALHPGH